MPPAMRLPFRATLAITNVSGDGATAATPPDARVVKKGFDPYTCRLNLHLQSLVSSGRLAQARVLFDRMAPSWINAFSLNRMFSGYSRSGQIAEAHNLFLSSSPRLRDSVTWTVMMGALAVPGCAADAGALFRDMLREGVAPDRVTIFTVLRMTAVLNVPASSGTTTASLHPFAVKLCLPALASSSATRCSTPSASTASSRPSRGCSRRHRAGTTSPTTP
ncbi:hypothetical protein QYE76_064747 [Lolium multiflorum]|uniref:Pentatricopeptide repeat-containing protein n=1 Tax=Lolium multiflorum TaxID=4521 RepID=A0AAD8S7K2_LOLMU|nr:hypothetical protein QYE76_064747 [Lolium multiflorum]